LALWAGCRFFPRGTVHVAVIDPGVGSSRRAIAVQSAGFWFVGPDNGVLSWALAGERILRVHALENRRYCLQPISRTFHGRDLFAPAAAHLSRGLAIRKLGPALKDYTRLPWPEPRPAADGVEGEVVYIDRFGNAITNLDLAMLRGLGQGPAEVWLGRKRLCPVADHYQAVPPGRPVAVPGSSGLLEIALNGASAARRSRSVSGPRCGGDEMEVKAGEGEDPWGRASTAGPAPRGSPAGGRARSRRRRRG
jgi:S-adenosylmethionine hydrolase